MIVDPLRFSSLKFCILNDQQLGITDIKYIGGFKGVPFFIKFLDFYRMIWLKYTSFQQLRNAETTSKMTDIHMHLIPSVKLF